MRSGKFAKRTSTEPSTKCLNFLKKHLKQIQQNVNIVRSRWWVQLFVLSVLELFFMYRIFYKASNDSLIHIFFPNLIQPAPHLKLWKQRWKRRYPFCRVQAFLSWRLPFLFVCMNRVKHWADGK